MTEQQGPTKAPRFYCRGCGEMFAAADVVGGMHTPSWSSEPCRGLVAVDVDDMQLVADLVTSHATLLAAAEQAALHMELDLSACGDLDAHDDPCVHRLLTDAIAGTRGEAAP